MHSSHETRQTENTLRSYSILNLETLFKFVSQCNLIPFLESRLCNVMLEMSWITAILQLYSQVADPLWECNCKTYKYETF